MSRIFACLAGALTIAAVGEAWAQQPAPLSATPPPAVVAPPAPAFKVGATVTDRTGARLGPIQSLTEAAQGPIVVIKIDGKLIGVPQSTLSLKGGGAVSSQTKAEIVAAAGAG